ncbi:MAG: hypothetical protein ACK4FV_01705 [Candidatus Nitrosocaldus sp.]
MSRVIIDDVEVTDDNTAINISIRVEYTMRYDGIQVNTHVYDARGIIRFTEVNGRNVNMYRLFMSRDEIEKSNGRLNIKAVIEGKDAERVRIRASIIQEHKEVEYDERIVNLR